MTTWTEEADAMSKSATSLKRQRQRKENALQSLSQRYKSFLQTNSAGLLTVC